MKKTISFVSFLFLLDPAFANENVAQVASLPAQDQNIKVISREDLSAAKARQFLNRYEDYLSQWGLEDSAGEEAVTDAQIAETKKELCKLLNLKSCNINLPTSDGAALVNNDQIVIGEIQGIPQKKSAVISFKNNQVTFFNEVQNDFYQRQITE